MLIIKTMNSEYSNETCSYCGSSGAYTVHGYYERNVIEYKNGKAEYRRLRIRRLKCRCGHTHAVLPDELIPYSQFSLNYLANILEQYYQRKDTVLRICAEFNAAPVMLLRWRNLCNEHFLLTSEVLKTMREAVLPDVIAAPEELLKVLNNSENVSEFQHIFYEVNDHYFLQGHK